MNNQSNLNRVDTMKYFQNDEFDQLVEKVMDEWKIPGLSIAIIHGDDVWSKPYGFAKLSPKTPTTEKHLFDCASTSKSFTAAAVALLVQDNENFPEVQWDTPVSKLLPDDFVLPDPMYTEHVTVEDILSHRTGMPRHDDSYLGQRAANPDTPKSITRNLRNLPLSKPLRTAYQYNNMMFTAATYLVETLTKKPYGEFLKERLWDPLGMTHTYHDLPDVQARGAEENLATGYVWDRKKGEYLPGTWKPEPEGHGAGSIISCAPEYIKWVSSFLKKTGPLSDETRAELVKGRILIHWEPEDDTPFYGLSAYCLGLQSESYRGHQLMGHGGNVSGFESMMRWMPQHGWGVYIIGNSNGVGDASLLLIHWLIDRMLGVKEDERIDWYAWWLENKAKSDAEDNDAMEEWETNLRKQERVELGVPLEKVAGHYHDPGYKDMIVEFKDGKLLADCSDRCYGLLIEFQHISGNVFVALLRDLTSAFTNRMKAELKIENGIVKSLGLEFEETLKGRLIWFHRVE